MTLCVLAGCGAGAGEHETHSTMAKIASMSKDSISYEVSREDLTDMYLQMAEDLQGEELFLTPVRQHELVSFPCSNCHTVNLDQLKSKTAKKAHWDIELIHAPEGVMNCITCHQSNNLETLVSLSGQEVSFNNSQNLCAQCHSTQFNDWKGGAHGKAIGGWVDPRVSYSCVNCHDPHKTAFEPRWPARLNTVQLSEQNPDK